MSARPAPAGRLPDFDRLINELSEAHAFAWNAATAAHSVEIMGEAFQAATLGWQPEAVKARGEHLAALARLIADQLNRSLAILSEVLDGPTTGALS